ncbi:MAG: hypothetical protein HY926_12305 [Elusimicrobia bacterium]|nr:hypothetical protein [Elusimicrobiota bacterium]
MDRERAAAVGAVLIVSGLALSAVFWTRQPPLRTGEPAAVPPEALASGRCRSLEQCAPGCFRGKAYGQKVCTADVGQTSCFDDLMGDEICAPPGYDPIRAFAALTQEQRDKMVLRKAYLGPAPARPADLGEGLNPALK